jgi:hypothetical protein
MLMSNDTTGHGKNQRAFHAREPEHSPEATNGFRSKQKDPREAHHQCSLSSLVSCLFPTQSPDEIKRVCGVTGRATSKKDVVRGKTERDTNVVLLTNKGNRSMHGNVRGLEN